jgi:hypothetical protein
VWISPTSLVSTNEIRTASSVVGHLEELDRLERGLFRAPGSGR